MKHPIVTVLVIAGVMSVGVAVALIAYVVIAKPFGIGLQNVPSSITPSQNGEEKTPSSNPLLTPEQDAALQNLGVDTSALPTSISPEQMTCAVAALGDTRVQELIAGAQLTLTDVYKAKGCL